VLSAMIRSAVLTRHIHGVKVSRGASKVSHLSSGQVINFEKSEIFFSPNVESRMRRDIISKLDVREAPQQNESINEIHRAFNCYWWGNGNKDNLIRWDSWESMCISKSRGGMGFRHMKAFNKALLAKQCWRLITIEKSLPARILKARGQRWNVGNGMKVRIWEDYWLEGIRTLDYRTQNCEYNVINDLLDADTGRKAHLLEDKQIPSVGVFDEVFSIWKAFGGNTRDLSSFGEETDKTTDLHHHFSRLCSQRLETASQDTRDAVTIHSMTVSQEARRRQLA
ncbi:hypothetical protein Tco_0576687, partial [Tanacetum coccineum]